MSELHTLRLLFLCALGNLLLVVAIAETPLAPAIAGSACGYVWTHLKAEFHRIRAKKQEKINGKKGP